MPRRTAHEATLPWLAFAALTLMSSLRLGREQEPRDHPAQHRDDDEGDHEGPGREWRIGEQGLDGVRPVGQEGFHPADGRPELVKEVHRHPLSSLIWTDDAPTAGCRAASAPPP